MICQFCGYEFDDACGKYGCPNCNGEGLDSPIGDREMDLRITFGDMKRVMAELQEAWGADDDVIVIYDQDIADRLQDLLDNSAGGDAAA